MLGVLSELEVEEKALQRGQNKVSAACERLKPLF